jgi:hypothetical protein
MLIKRLSVNTLDAMPLRCVRDFTNSNNPWWLPHKKYIIISPTNGNNNPIINPSGAIFRFINVKCGCNIQRYECILLLKGGMDYLCAIFENTHT